MSVRMIYRKPNNSNFSGELGADASGMRRIVVTGTGTVESWLATVEQAETYLRGQLAAQGGWDIVNFDFRQTSWTRISGLDFSINITANVPNAYSNKDHLDFLARLMNDYVINYFIGQSQGITNLRLQADDGTSVGQKPPEDNIFLKLFGAGGLTIGAVAGIAIIYLLVRD